MLPHAVYDQIKPRAVDSMPNYYGVKLHVLESYQIGSMPISESIGLTNAGVNDGKAYLANQHIHTV